VNPLHQLKKTIESLNSQQLEIQKQELLSLIEALPCGVYATAAADEHGRLSPRESQVMRMMLDGQRLKEIAAKLDISVKTVTTHRTRLLRKLGLDDNLGLYRYGVRHGLIAV
jgi:DNA-binding NarL/FixJ family response regulator